MAHLIPTESLPALPSALTPDRTEASLRESVRDGCAHAVMMGAGEGYLSPYAIFLGMGSLGLGLLASVPVFLGSLVQLGAVRLLDRAGRRKALVVAPALLQGLCWAPIVLLPWLVPAWGPASLLVFGLLYFALGAFAVPGWNSWVGDLVPPPIRGDYFGRREQLRMGFQLGSLLAAGLVLWFAGHRLTERAGFAIIFGVALAARMLSTWHIGRMDEPAYRPPAREETFTFWDFLRRSPRSNFARFSIFVACTMAATNLAGPFFALFMLRDLHFSYLQFTAASAVIVLAQSLTMRYWGRLGDRYGHRMPLVVTGLFLGVLPILWLISSRFEAILVYQALAGVTWAGFNLSASNFLFDAVTPPKRARCVTYYGILVNLGVLLGANAGGLVAPHLPVELSLGSWRWPLVSGLQVLFLVSGLARIGVALVFLPMIREVREIGGKGAPSLRRTFLRVAGLNPIRGFRFVVFGGVHPSERKGGHSTFSSEDDRSTPEARPKK